MVDARTLAIGCACYLKGWAVLDFPGTSRSNPSEYVYVQRSTTTPKDLPSVGTKNFEFPLLVRWDVWRQVVVPTLIGTPLPTLGSFSATVSVLETDFTVRLKTEGFLPS